MRTPGRIMRMLNNADLWKVISFQMACLLLLLISFNAQSQEYINTDRPDQTESPFVMGKRSLQVESGLLYNTFDKHNSAFVSRGLVRYGISHWMELRMLVEQGVNRDTYMEESIQGNYPLAASTKILIAREHRWKTAITLLAYLQLPFTPRTREQENYWSPGLLMAFGHKFNKTFGLEYNVGIKQNAYDKDYAGVLNTSFKYIFSKKFQGFTEYFGQFAPTIHPNHNVDTGLMYTPHMDIQIDAAVGTRIYEVGEQNQFATLGFSWRFF